MSNNDYAANFADFLDAAPDGAVRHDMLDDALELHQRLVDHLAAGRVDVASAELHEPIQGNKERL